MVGPGVIALQHIRAGEENGRSPAGGILLQHPDATGYLKSLSHEKS